MTVVMLAAAPAPLRAQQAAERDSAAMLGARRIAALPAAEREAWTRYVARSRELRARDRAAMDAELEAAGRAKMVRAPYQREAFEVTKEMTDAWFAGDSARRIADHILSFQAPNGGWSKHVDFTKGPREPGQSYNGESDGWQYIGTIDNSSTTSQLAFLGRAERARPEPRYREAFGRGLGYLLDAQFPTGCWPQVYPLQGSYHDAATFNDDAIVHVLELLGEVGRGAYPFVPEAERARAAAAEARGIDCIVASQVVVSGARTAWGQQHDPLTLAPAPARSYELVSLSSKESAGIVRYLLKVPKPDRRVVEAVHAAADWFNATTIRGFRYVYNQGLVADTAAGPLWARMYEIGTNRPIFSNRDGVKLYDSNLLTDRRTGYGWFSEEPRAALRQFERWARTHPRPVPVRKEGG